ncbi:ammonium transporter [Wallemia mellicola]|uniref:Ammonium transporter n=1 Tax=Wallemia mellicola TaxID=1708541 RepID=A0A4T0LJ18_9BASI|nr:hypothetical protein E3Q24_03293 [Wallemia mellicola]TIB73709.1 hypothetical protein E3Q23_02919 [Wallemia mellicola]TIB83101.1 ammonium transporter [Wallemia mellicola]TIB85820.1 ammonium transporter [Wallemia mellicola]TIB89898.1 ammonium transporter [Wallemia mellicola]
MALSSHRHPIWFHSQTVRTCQPSRVHSNKTPANLPLSTGEPKVFSQGDIAWQLMSTALVWLMIPGVGLFYAGLTRRKNALQLLLMSLIGIAVVSIEWICMGYSLVFGPSHGGYIGDLQSFGGFTNLLDQDMSNLPILVHAWYQGTFACITVVIAMGALAERGRLLPSMIFMLCWTIIVYNPIAHWTWNENGWLAVLGSLDFAGGSPVHINAGTAALAISFFLGKRRGHGTLQLAYRPHSPVLVFLGTVFLWIGWFGFNGGSAFGANMRAAQACIVTNLSASVGGITWMFLDWRLEKKISAVGFCSGAIAGLVCITPGSGYVSTPSAFAIGFIGAVAANFGTKVKDLLHLDESLDIFASHGIAGICGNILTALFAEQGVTNLDGLNSDAEGGWINHNYILLGYQLADTVTVLAYSFVLTYTLLFLINLIPGCKFRASEEDEIIGMDLAELGEPESDLYDILHAEVPTITQNQASSQVGIHSTQASEKAQESA